MVLCIIALVRIFTLSAAFPFFNNVDEQAHFDMVIKYARGYLPSNQSNKFDQESAEMIAGYGTTEYFHRESVMFRTPFSAAKVNYYLTIDNHEAFSPPLYYMIAGAWYNLGKVIGFRAGYLLYWIRFMNLPIYTLLLWVAYLFCRYTEPDNLHLRMGILLLLSFLPQDVFYSINGDVLSPLLFTSGLLLLTKIYRDNSSFWLYPLAGIMFAGTVLVKLSNFPALLIFIIILLMLVRKFNSTGQLVNSAPHLLAMLVAIIVPLIIWIGFNLWVPRQCRGITQENLYSLGDITGASHKIEYFGWTVKPFSEWGNHPVFTLQGIVYFLSELTRTFWRGEFVWHLERVASKGADIIYIVTTLIFGTAGIAGIISERKNVSSDKKYLNYLLIFILVSYILFLMMLSIRYDFGDCLYPSKEFPYFTSGRLILASLVPFLIIYIKGIELITAKISKRINSIAVIIIIVLYSGISEIVIIIERGVFASPYNFFHL
jgi:hypothetical protein